MAKKKKPNKALKDSMKLNESIKANTTLAEAPVIVKDNKANGSAAILKELMKNV
jgi:hypothetical protein